MKDQATHILLIRDENGTPIEAEYMSNALSNSEEVDFYKWAPLNRIPVTGDWPDREVFAMEEVDWSMQVVESESGRCVPKKCLYLKAKQEVSQSQPTKA